MGKGKQQLAQGQQPGGRWFWGRGWRSGRSWLLAIVVMGLGGCGRYELGIQFDSQTAGTIVQHLSLDRDLWVLSPRLGEQWFSQIQSQWQAPALGHPAPNLTLEFPGSPGKPPDPPKPPKLQGIQHQEPGEIFWRLPFYGTRDLVQKFNQLFDRPLDRPQSREPWRGALPEVSARLELDQDNRGLALRNHLHLTLNLGALGGRPWDPSENLAGEQPQEPTIGGLGDWPLTQAGMAVAFGLQTPWGLDWAAIDPPIPPQITGTTWIWELPLQDDIHLEAVFWVPSPIGLSALAITLLIIPAMAVAHWSKKKSQGNQDFPSP